MAQRGTNPNFQPTPAPQQGNRLLCGPCWDGAHGDCEHGKCECLCTAPEPPRTIDLEARGRQLSFQGMLTAEPLGKRHG
jgi:hypothetical protein